MLLHGGYDVKRGDDWGSRQTPVGCHPTTPHPFTLRWASTWLLNIVAQLTSYFTDYLCLKYVPPLYPYRTVLVLRFDRVVVCGFIWIKRFKNYTRLSRVFFIREVGFPNNLIRYVLHIMFCLNIFKIKISSVLVWVNVLEECVTVGFSRKIWSNTSRA